MLGAQNGVLVNNWGGFSPYYAISPQVIRSGGAEFTGWLPNIPQMNTDNAPSWGRPVAYPSLAPVQADRWQPAEPTEPPEPEPEAEPIPDKRWTPPQYRENQDPTLLKQDLKVALEAAKKAGEAALPEESKQPAAKMEARDQTFEWKEAARHYKDGLISPFTSMWQNKRKTAIGVGIGGALLMLSRGLILPVFTTLGFAVTAVQLGGGLYKVVREKDPDLKERAFYNFGAASSTLLLNWLTGISGSLKRVVETQDDLMAAGTMTEASKILKLTAKEIDDLSGLKTVETIVRYSPKCLLESFKHIFNPSKWGHVWEKASKLHLTIADGVKSTFSQGGIIGSLMMVLRHLANGYEVFSDAHLDLTNLPDLTPQQREYLRKTMAQRAQQLGQLPGVNNLANINWSNLPMPNMPDFNKLNPMRYWPNAS